MPYDCTAKSVCFNLLGFFLVALCGFASLKSSCCHLPGVFGPYDINSYFLFKTHYQQQERYYPFTDLSIMSIITSQGTDFLLCVFAAAVVSWADHCAPLLVGIRAQWFPWQQSSLKTELSHDLYVNPDATELPVASCLLGIPYSMKQLLAKEPWKSQSQKVWHLLSFILQFKCVVLLNGF